MLDAPQSSAISKNGFNAGSWFSIVAIVIVIAVGMLMLRQTLLASSPATRLTDRLVRSGKFEALNYHWGSDWSLADLEQAPWSKGRATGADIDPQKDIIVLNFWATWCEPCRAELPDMLKLAKELEDRRVWFAFVGYDGSWAGPRKLLQRVIKTLSKNVVFVRDPTAEPGGLQTGDALMRKMGTEKLPETYFIKGGRVYGKIIGAINWNHPDVRDYLRILAQ